MNATLSKAAVAVHCLAESEEARSCVDCARSVLADLASQPHERGERKNDGEKKQKDRETGNKKTKREIERDRERERERERERGKNKKTEEH